MLENTEWTIKIQEKLATRREKKPQSEHNVCWTPLCTHIIYKMLENTEWAIKIQEKLATQGTQDEKHPYTTQCVLDTTMRKQTQTT